MDSTNASLNVVSLDSDDFEFDVYYSSAIRFKEVLLSLSIVIGIISLITNSYIIIVMLTMKKLQCISPNCFINYISFVDLLFATWLSILINQDEFGNHISISGSWQVATVIAMVLILINLQVALSGDRFWAVCFPMAYFKRKHNSYRQWLVLTCALLGLPVPAMHLFGWNNCSSNDYCGLGDLNSGFKMAFALWTGIASVAIAVMNGCIIFAILRSGRKRRQLFEVTSSRALVKSYELEMKLSVTMMIVIVSFFICWTPIALHFAGEVIQGDYYFSYYTLERFVDTKTALNLCFIIRSFALFATLLNSIIDPIIYAWRIKELREVTKDLLSTVPLNLRNWMHQKNSESGPQEITLSR